MIAPDDLISQGYGADTVRIMELFIGPWNQSAAWSIEGMGGCFRFLQRIWTLNQEFLEAEKDGDSGSEAIIRLVHQAIAKVSADLRDMGFNTAIAALMETVNQLYKQKAESNFAHSQDWQFVLTTLAQLVAPFAPHIAEELWQQLGNSGSVHNSTWPVHDEKYLTSDTTTVVVQINGKLRAQLSIATDATEEVVTALAKNDPKVIAYLKNLTIKKIIYVPGKLVNFVT